jgi:putative AlgH/UPF0301 family transcriptional regulator
VFSGGPVEESALIALAETTQALLDHGEHLSPIVGTIASADLTADPALVAAEVVAVRVFRGYAGWGPGQLEGEIEAGAWLVLDSEPATCSPTTPTSCGARSCDASRAVSPGSPRARRPQLELTNPAKTTQR